MSNLKGKIGARFPANVSVVAPLILDRTGGDFVFSIYTPFPDPIITTDNAIARYNGTAGILQNSSAIVNDDGSINAASYKIATKNALSFPGGDTFDNIAIGDGVLGNIAGPVPLGTHNIGIGTRVLEANTTGFANIGIGYQTLRANTTGQQNTAMGDTSMELNTTGDFNAAFGVHSMQNNTTGSQNAGIGHAAITANTTGSFNSAIGFNALRFNTTGDSNSAGGHRALEANLTGSFNAAFGDKAMLAALSGDYNSAFGSLALTSVTTGQLNVAVGRFSLGLTTTGQGNVAVGPSALAGVTTASFVTAVGFQALIATTGTGNIGIGPNVAANLTSGTFNTIIGYGTGAGITTGGKNTIIGSQITGLSSSLANSIILADGDGNIRLDYAKTTAATWTMAGGPLNVSAGTVTASAPAISATQTWNNGAVAFTGLLFNATNTASDALSRLIDVQIGGSSKFFVTRTGLLSTDVAFSPFIDLGGSLGAGYIHVGRLGAPTIALVSIGDKGGGAPPGVFLRDIGGISWTNSTTSVGTLDTFITRPAAATIQHGTADAAAPVAQNIRAQSVVAGTADTVGVNLTYRGSLSTGSGASGDIIYQTGAKGAASTTQNAANTALTLKGGTAVGLSGSVVVGSAAIATTATDGFLYIPSCAGTPTGVPTTFTGRVPMVWDSTNKKFYIYQGGWLGGTVPGVFS